MLKTTRFIITAVALIAALGLAAGCSKKGKEKVKSEKSTATAVNETKPPVNEMTGGESLKEKGNHPPRIVDITLKPSFPVTGDHIEAKVKAEDPDGDPVECSYSWYINGQLLKDIQGPELRHPIKRGDKIKVVVVATDGKATSQEVTATTAVGNAPPKAELEKQEIKGNKYMAWIKAQDPEGDPITFELKKAPSGMTIDDSSGLIQWTIGPKDFGHHEILVSVKDDKGAETQVYYTINVKVGNEKG